MTMLMSVAGLILFKEQAQSVSIAGRDVEWVVLRRFCCRAGAMAEPELTPSHQGCSKDLPKLRGLHLFLPHSFSMGLQQWILLFHPLEC